MDKGKSLDGTNYEWTNKPYVFRLWESNNTGKFNSFKLLTLTAKSNGDDRYICIPYSNPQWIFVKAKAYSDRIYGGFNPKTWDLCRTTFTDDFKHNANAIKIYANSGQEIAVKDRWEILDSCFKFAGVNSENKLKDADKLRMLVDWWRKWIIPAQNFAKRWTKPPTFDARLYTVPAEKRTLSLGVWTRVGFLKASAPNSDPSVTVLENVCTNLNAFKTQEEREKYPPETLQCAFEYLEENKLKGSNWITIANHPLGFYSLCIQKKDLEDIVKLQCGGAYFRDVPPCDEVVSFNSGLTVNTSLTSAETERSVQISSKSFQARDKRIPTKTIMGKFANEWAKNRLKWTIGSNQDDRVVVAEWLHVIAHDLGGTDDKENLVFGTRECNTYMLRAETAIREVVKLEQLNDRAGRALISCRINRSDPFSMLKSDGTYEEHSLAEKVKNNARKIYVMTLRSWLAGEIHYKTMLKLKLGTVQQVGSSTIQFQPLHRLVPFRYEASLDSQVKLAFAKHLVKTMPKANNDPRLKSHELSTDLRSKIK